MRKSKLIILPTRCLNHMGFLLLFLACPVIGEWGRIRPDTEMSQWSIILDREGTCGLVRNSSKACDEPMLSGPRECETKLSDDSALLTSYLRGSEESGSGRQMVAQRSDSRRLQERAFRVSDRYSREGNQGAFDRRAASLDRRVQVSRRVEKATYQRDNSRRLTVETRGIRQVRDNDRRVESRLRETDIARRLSVSRERDGERRARERRSASEPSRRESSLRLERREGQRINNAERRNQRSSRATVRADNAERHISVRREISERSAREERRTEHRKEHRDRVSGAVQTRSVNERRAMRLSETRQASTERTKVSDKRIQIREQRLNPNTRREQHGERRIEAEGNRRQSTDRQTRSSVESIRLRDSQDKQHADIRRLEEMRSVDRRRIAKPETGRILTRTTDRKPERMDSGIKLAAMSQKKANGELPQQWKLFDGLKGLIGIKHDETVGNYDLATPCLVGAAVYFLTTRRIKSVY